MDRTLIKPVAFLDLLVTVAVGGLKVPNLVPRGRDPFGQRRGSVTPGDAVAPIIVFILYNRPEGISAQVKYTETSKVCPDRWISSS